jgi:UDP-glucose 6-dehydrogenase
MHSHIFNDYFVKINFLFIKNNTINTSSVLKSIKNKIIVPKNNDILTPLQNISKSWSTKINVFGLNFKPNTSNFFDSLLFIFCKRGGIYHVILS